MTNIEDKPELEKLALEILFNVEESDEAVLEELIKKLEKYSKRDILDVVEFMTGALSYARKHRYLGMGN